MTLWKWIAWLWALCLLAGSESVLLGQTAPEPLRASEDGRRLVSHDGRSVFLLGDTAWGMSWDLTREDVEEYLDIRRAQDFNVVAMVAGGWADEPNAYGDEPFHRRDDRPDPTQRAATPGADPNDGRAYDFWDHVDFCIEQAAARGMYVVLLPTWGEAVAGSWSGEDTSGIIYGVAAAYDYGRWIGARYRDRTNVLWMMGGDRSPIYVKQDYRPVFRAMAEGVVEGVQGGEGQNDQTILMSYHPRKERPNSSHWFHEDEWLTFNSIQGWPEEQVWAVAEDWSRVPARPTWLFEGRYEGYNRGGYVPEDWGAWQVRYQAYQTVFAGAFGHVYGHENVFGFGDGWRESARAPGAVQMGYLSALMNLWEGRTLTPDQALIEGDAGVTRRLTSHRVQALRSEQGEMAMVYVANGRTIDVRMDRLSGPSIDAYWFNPRSGRWHGASSDERRAFITGVRSGGAAPVQRFDPPGDAAAGNDWVLVLEHAP